MKVTVVERYRDMELGKIKEPGETFEASKERAGTLLRKGFVKEAKEKNRKEEPETK